VTLTTDRLVTLESHECGDCGITFAAPKTWWDTRRTKGGTFYCPNGHPRVFRETDVDRLQKQLDTAQRDKKYWESRFTSTRAVLEAEKRSKAAYKGQLTKTKKRIGNGVCPCCNRTFANLHRHMSGQHPEYGKPIE